jgi:hypothetical protein
VHVRSPELWRTGAAAAATVALLAAPLSAQTVVELRGSTTKYRFVDVAHTFANRIVLDALYVGVPGMNELYLGAGYQLRPSAGVSVAPVLYAVLGRESHERGLCLGALLAVDRGGWRAAGFAGHFFRTSGEVADYTFVDALDVTRAFGRWELGASTGVFATGGDATWLVGPTVKRNDRRGAWAASARFGDDTEFRLLRILTF